MAPSATSLQTLAEQWIFRHYAPAAVLVNDHGDILFISGRTGLFLEPAAGKANWNLFVMAREELRYELTNAFQRALRERVSVNAKSLRASANGQAFEVDIEIQVIEEPESLIGLVMVVFRALVVAPKKEDKAGARKSFRQNSRVRELEREIQRMREDAQSTREEMQTSQEELKSTNEELQSTNEELQSTNEELTTSKEEMQSLNEELQTVNAELQAKVDELSAASSDMKNLLNSTEIATIFLDSKLRVRRFTEKATTLFSLIPGDIGRPITDLSSNLRYPDLFDDACEVLRTLVPLEKSIKAKNETSFSMRLMPYRTQDDRIDGVVITFMDLSVSKNFAQGRQVQRDGMQ